MPKPKTNSFADAVKKKDAPSVGEGGSVAAPAQAPRRKSKVKPSRVAVKHIGGYFDPATSKQLRMLAVEKDTTVQGLLEQALDLLFHANRKPEIAKKIRG